VKAARNVVKFDERCASAPWSVVFDSKMTVSRHASEQEAQRIADKLNALVNRSSIAKMIVDVLKEVRQ